MRHVAIFGAILFWLSPTAAALAMTEAEYELMLSQTPWEKTERGHEEREIELPGGVFIWQKREGDEIVSRGLDRSGHGAVLCVWEFIVEFESFLDICRGDDDHWKTELSSAIERTNEFIISNDFTGSIIHRQNRRRTHIHSRNLKSINDIPEDDLAEYCTNSPVFFRRWLSEGGLDNFRTFLDDVLSVPRFPVMSPCV